MKKLRNPVVTALDTQNNGGITVSNALYYSRRLPEVSSMHCGRSLDGGLSKLEAVALAKELCEAAVSSLGSPCRARLLFCPLCTQSFGYSYGLESHLLSVHHDELLADRRPKVDLRDTSFSRETVNCGSFRICRMRTVAIKCESSGRWQNPKWCQQAY